MVCDVEIVIGCIQKESRGSMQKISALSTKFCYETKALQKQAYFFKGNKIKFPMTTYIHKTQELSSFCEQVCVFTELFNIF